MKMIGFGIVSYHLIYISLPLLFNGIRFMMLMLLSKATLSAQYTITGVFINCLAEFIVGSPTIYFFFASLIKKITSEKKGKKQSLTQAQMQFTAIALEKEVGRKALVALIVFSVSLLNFFYLIIVYYLISNYSYLDLVKDDPMQTRYTSILDLQLIPISIFYYVFLERFILHYKLYKHQQCALVVILVGFCTILSANWIHETKLEVRIPILCFCYMMTSTQYVVDKWLMQSKYFPIYELLFYQGSLGLILTVIVGFILVSSDLNPAFGNIYQLFDQLSTYFQSKTIGFFIGTLTTNCLFSVCAFLINYHYTPMHTTVSNLLYSFMHWILLLATDITTSNNAWVIGVAYVVVFIGVIVYTEIVICYFFDLHVNTKKEIEMRSKQDGDTTMISMVDENEKEVTVKLSELGNFKTLIE